MRVQSDIQHISGETSHFVGGGSVVIDEMDKSVIYQLLNLLLHARMILQIIFTDQEYISLLLLRTKCCDSTKKRF